MKILVPIDGSANANRAVEQVIASRAWLKEAPQVFLLNVQWKLATANVKMFINQETINAYYREEGMAALAAARALLDKAGLAY
ncbi:MAG TPA: universal stress protein, partial [Gallionellaceae bacterium]|nr:universal stress protein [Gallionellaceae bacterium]